MHVNYNGKCFSMYKKYVALVKCIAALAKKKKVKELPMDVKV